MNRKHGFIIFLVVWQMTVFSQEPRLEADKPDQSSGASAVGKNNLQLETSFYHNQFKETAPAWIASGLLRYGLTEKAEVFMIFEQGLRRNEFIATAQGQYPLAAGAKFMLFEEQHLLPAISVAAYVNLPFTNGSEPKYWSPAFVLIAEKEWEPVTLTLNGSRQKEAFENAWQWQGTCDVKCKLNQKTDLFAEYFGAYSTDRPVHNIDTGFMYYVNNNIMIHIAAGSTVFYQPYNYFVTSGFAVRFH